MTPSKQGQKGAAAAPPDRRAGQRRLGLLVFGVLLIGLFVIVAVAQGIGGPSVPDGSVAFVDEAPDGDITQEDFDRSLEQTAARQQLKEVPPTDDPQYEQLKNAALSDLILSRWVLGEAEERGIEVSDREVDTELQKVIDQQFGSQKAFDKFLEQSGFTADEARDRIRLQLISDRIQQEVLPDQPEVTDDEIESYYEDNKAQFEQPETRDVRVVLTKTEAEADQAYAALQRDSSPKGWEQVAKQYSVDEATKSSGGLREAVVEGQNEPALDDRIFSSTEGELVPPFQTEKGWYVIQVEKVTPAVTTSLDDAKEDIRKVLIGARQQAIATAFQEDFTAKWRDRTECADGYRIDRCANAEPPPDTCTEKVAETTGCGAPVPSTKPIEPGAAAVFGSAPAPGRPQGPISAAAAGGAQQLPPGLIPTQPGAAPPGAAPPGAAPTAPPGG